MSENVSPNGESEQRCQRCARPLFGGECRVCRLIEDVLGANAAAEEIERANGGKKSGSTDDESE